MYTLKKSYPNWGMLELNRQRLLTNYNCACIPLYLHYHSVSLQLVKRLSFFLYVVFYIMFNLCVSRSNQKKKVYTLKKKMFFYVTTIKGLTLD